MVQAKHAEAAATLARSRAECLTRVRSACAARGIAVGPPLFRDMRRTLAQPYVEGPAPSSTPSPTPSEAARAPAGAGAEGEGAGELHWPVMILYPEYGTSDYLEDVGETASIADIVSHVLPPTERRQQRSAFSSNNSDPPATARAPWDVRGEYLAGNVDVFFRTHAAAPVPLASAWEWDPLMVAGLAGADGGEGRSAGVVAPADALGGGEGTVALAADAMAAVSLGDATKPPPVTTAAPTPSTTAPAAADDGAADGMMTGAVHAERGAGGPQKWVRVPPAAPLMALTVAPGFVVTDIPVLYVVAKSSVYHAELKRRCGGAFNTLAPPQ